MAEEVLNGRKDYSKVSGIVDQVINDLGLTQHYYAKLLGWALWGLRELRLDQAQEVKTIRRTISDVKTVTLPADYVDWVKIGVPRGQYIFTLSVNGDLNKEERTLGNPTLTRSWPLDSVPNGIDFGEYGGYFFANFNGSSFFSVGGGLPSQGLFTVADRGDGCHEILFDKPVCDKECVVEYISDGMDPCGETIVNAYLADYIRNYVIHQNERFRPVRERNMSAIVMTGRDLADSERKIRARNNNLRPKDMLHISRKHFALRSKV